MYAAGKKMAAECIANKSQIRKEVKTLLRSLPTSYITDRSNACILRALELPQYQASNAVSAYTAMPAEIQTTRIIENILSSGKDLCIPKVLGRKSTEMMMVKVDNMESLLSLPRNSWGIPEHTSDMLEGVGDFTEEGSVDLVVVPGVAFDQNGNRLGHGKGYYDSFLERLLHIRKKLGKKPPFVMALALDEQIIESVPTIEHDLPMDAIVTPTRTILFERSI